MRFGEYVLNYGNIWRDFSRVIKNRQQITTVWRHSACTERYVAFYFNAEEFQSRRVTCQNRYLYEMIFFLEAGD